MNVRTPRRAVALAVAALLLLAAVPGVALAEQRGGGTVVVGPDETVQGDLQAFGGTVVVRGTVTGDLSAVGGAVQIPGTVQGSVEASAGSVEISGTVGGDVDVAAGSLLVADGATVRGSLNGGAGSAVFAGTVEGDVTVGADTLRFADTASVGGDLRYDADDVSGLDAVSVGGTVTRDEGLVTGPQFSFAPQIPSWGSVLYGLVANLLLGALLVAGLPAYSSRLAERVSADPLRLGAAGFVALVGVPVVLVLVAITVVGIPLALIGLLAYLVALWVGFVYGAYAVGAWALDRAGVETSRWVHLAVGVVAFSLVGVVPVLGALLQFAALLLGLGALALGGYRRLRGRRPGAAASSAESAPESGDEPAGTSP